MPDAMGDEEAEAPDAADPAELDPDRFDDDEARRRRDDLATLDDLLADSALTEDDIEVLDAVVKEGLRELHVELKTGQEKRGMDRI